MLGRVGRASVTNGENKMCTSCRKWIWVGWWGEVVCKRSVPLKSFALFPVKVDMVTVLGLGVFLLRTKEQDNKK